MQAVAMEARATGFRSAAELTEVLDRLLRRADADEQIGPLLRAARMRTRFVFTDLGVRLNLASASKDLDRCLEWSFADRPPWTPLLSLEMDSAVANSYLQGLESLPVAIARNRVRCRCDTRAALQFLPAAQLLSAPYRELISADYRHLLLQQPARPSAGAMVD
jgi:hypothetical protein